MKQKLFINLLLLVLLSTCKAFAVYFTEVDGIRYYFDNYIGSDCVVIGTYNTSIKEIIIPTYIGAHRVTEIGEGAFSSCRSLTSITIPESVTSIGNNAFVGCSSLTSITIHEDVTSQDMTFYSQTNLANPLLGVTSIGNNAFVGCSSLTSVTIPEGVTSIGNMAFERCSSLTSITIPESVTSIGNGAFRSCRSLTSITIPESVTSIGGYAFEECSSLANITIPESVTSIGNGTFLGCFSLTSITIPESVTSIGDWAFKWCSALPVIDNIRYADIYAIETVDKTLSTYTLKEGTKFIGSGTFDGCSSLTSLTIPDEVTSIGEKAFYSCSALTSVTIPEGVTSIGDLAFYDCDNLTSITIPESVTSIGEKAFYSCSALTSITIPESVTSIGNYAFEYCPLPVFDNIRYAGTYAVGVVDRTLSTYTLKEGTRLIGPRAFERCSSLTSIIIPESVTSIGDWVFSECSKLTSITIPESVTFIGQSAFNCSSLVNITLPSNIIEIGNCAFPSKSTKIYTTRGSKTLLTLWNMNYTSPYETGTENVLSPSEINVVGTTQMTATVGIKNYYSGYSYSVNDNPIQQGNLTLQSRPEFTEELILKVMKDDVVYSSKSSCTPQKISPTVTRTSGTASSMTALASYIEGDAKVTAHQLTINGVSVNGNSMYLNGLRPNYSYTAEYTITVDNKYLYTGRVYLQTDALNFVNSQPKVISEGNVIIASSSNLDEAETDVGFEWRRTDWTNDFQSNIAGAYLFEGTQEGYIRNMNTNYLWKFRPYYRSADGAYFYGSWLGIDPTNTSYFEPTVHTYSSITVKGNSAQIKGYVMRGSDDITQQGFMYWKGSTRAGGNDVPETATMIEAKGTVMNANLRELDYETTYNYVAFVKTAEGETYYGEEKSFTTEMDTGMGLIEDPESDVKEEGVYDLSGRRINNMQEGIYIIRYTDGSSRKVFIN